MKHSIILVALVSFATISELVLARHSNSQEWLQYKQQHGKVYATPEEDAQRFSLFLAAKDRIRKHNADASASYTLGLNQFSDLTRDELTKLTGLDRPKATGNRSTPANVASEHPLLRAILDDPAPLPKEVDWRKAGRVTEVKNEREKYQCLADYAFVAAGLLEGQLLVRQPNRTKTISLSAQQQVDCTPDSYGCLGNTVQATLNYIAKEGGLESEHDYPYLGTTVKVCLFDESKVVLAPSGFLTLPENDDDALKKAVATFGPVGVLMQTGDTFAQYKSGIYKDPTCLDPRNNRYLLVVGYGTDPVEGEYWILTKMNYSIILVALIIGFATTISELVLARHSNSQEWLQYKQQHGKVYATPEEDARRFSLFLAAKDQIRQHNADETVSFKLGLNKFSDWTRDELTKLTGPASRNATAQQQSLSVESTELHPSLRAILDDPAPKPKEVDWRKVAGRVTDVKDQTTSTCDASYSFAAAGVLEGQLLVQNPNITKLVSLSAQQELDCGKRNFGCFSTGTANKALDDIADIGGILTDKDYPYCGWEDEAKCHFSKDKVVMSITGSAMLPKADGDALKMTVASFGPVAIAMQRGKKFKSYRSGIYDDKTCSQGVDHWVLLVGYGTDPTHGDYWIVKNSYGSNWGEEGYMRVKQGMCAISLYSTIPTFT